MSGRGGYQAPAHPAPVSGPGAMSRRTDGGPVQKLRDLPDAQYGEAKTFRELQQAAPLEQTPAPGMDSAVPAGGAAVPPSSRVVPFDAPSMRPDEPVTTGAALGPGPGPEVMPNSLQANTTADLLQRIASVSTSSAVQALASYASSGRA